jgi:CheY-like chemotaxis protein
MSDEVTRDEKGRWITPPKGAPLFTPATARSMALKRWENYRRSAVKRIVGEAKSVDTSVSTGADAFGLVASRQFAALMDSEKPKIDDLERLAKIMTGTGAYSERENAASPADSAISAPPAALRALLAEMEDEIQRRVERARAVDGDVKPSESEAE